MKLTDKLEAIIITAAKTGRDTNIEILLQEAVKAVKEYNKEVVGEDSVIEDSYPHADRIALEINNEHNNWIRTRQEELI